MGKLKTAAQVVGRYLAHSLKLFQNALVFVSFDDMFSEFCVFKSYLSGDHLAHWAKQKLTTEQR